MKTLKRFHLLVIAILAINFTIINIVACSNSKGGQCDECSSDSDCEDGYSCEKFSGSGSTWWACAEEGKLAVCPH